MSIVELSGESALLTTAEVAVAFAGFASVVTAFQRRDSDGLEPQDAIRFQLMITASLVAALFALLPFAISFFGAREATVWAVSSGLLAVYLVGSTIPVVRRTRSLTSSRALHPGIAGSFLGAAALTTLLLVLNAVGLVFERELGPYFAGLLYLLVLSGFSFARLLPMGPRSKGG